MISYGAIPVAPARTRSSAVAAAVRLAVCAAVMAIVALAMLVLSRPGPTELSVGHIGRYHGMHDPVTWAGCGPGGDCGAKYHWSMESFSPVPGRAIKIDFTHDHGSYANYYGEDGWVEGAHKHFPITATPPREDMPVIEEDTSEPLPPLEFWGKIFPIEKGYSNWLRHKDEDPEKPMTYAEWLAGVKKAKKEAAVKEGEEEEKAEEEESAGEGEEEAEEKAGAEEVAGEEGAGDGSAEKEEEEGGEDAKEEGAKEEPAAEEAKGGERPHGENHPMIFGDLDPIKTTADAGSGLLSSWTLGRWRKTHGV